MLGIRFVLLRKHDIKKGVSAGGNLYGFWYLVDVCGALKQHLLHGIWVDTLFCCRLKSRIRYIRHETVDVIDEGVVPHPQ